MAEVIFESDDYGEEVEVDLEDLQNTLNWIMSRLEEDRETLIRLEATFNAHTKQAMRDDERLHSQTLARIEAACSAVDTRVQALEKAVANMMGKMVVLGSVIGASAGGVASLLATYLT